MKSLLISSTLTGFFISKTQSVNDALRRGTLTACPFNLPFSLGYIREIAFAEPVVVGMREFIPDLDLLRLALGESTNFDY